MTSHPKDTANDDIQRLVGVCPPGAPDFSYKYRSAYFQTCMLGVIFFLLPGQFNAIASLAGGIDEHVFSQSTAVLYSLFCVFSFVAPSFVNRLGAKVCLVIGGLGYVLYIASLQHYKHTENGVFVVVASGLLGACAGLLWTAQGSLVLAYPTPETKGSYFATFWIAFNLGGVVGSIITFGTNFDVDKADAGDGADDLTFEAFLAVMSLGIILIFLLADPATVVRPDGSLVKIRMLPGWWDEFKCTLSVARESRLLLLVPLFLYSNFFYTYQFAPYNGRIFNTRSAGFNNIFYWASQMVGAKWFGMYLDNPQQSVETKARKGFWFLFALTNGSWAWALIVDYSYGVDELDSNSNELDFTDGKSSGAWWAIFLLYILWGFIDSLVQNWVYWALGQFSDDPIILARYAGFYKAVQNIGAAVSWQLDVYLSSRHQLAFNWTLFLLASVPASILLRQHFKGVNNCKGGGESESRRLTDTSKLPIEEL